MVKFPDSNWLRLSTGIVPLIVGSARLALIFGRGEGTLAAVIGETLTALLLAVLANWVFQLAFPRKGKSNWLVAMLVSTITLGVAGLLMAPQMSSLIVCVAVVATCQLLILGYAATALQPVLARAAKKKRKMRR